VYSAPVLARAGIFGLIGSLIAAGCAPQRCADPPPSKAQETALNTPPPKSASFADDVSFLDARAKTIVLEDKGGGRVALSAQYQGRVMTSAVSANGPSLGWINRSFIEAGKTGTGFDNYGGEDRFWLGPEGGQHGLYFAPGKPFTFDEWQTPHALQEGAWTVADQKPDRVSFTKSMTVTTWSKTDFVMDVERTVRLLSRDEAKQVLKLGEVPASVEFVAYETKNRIVNRGPKAWTKESGLPSIWILAMFAPAADARVIIPFERASGEIVNDRYFGKVPASRLAVHEDKGFLAFTCDGKERGKIGVGPSRAKSVLGSFSASSKLLTVVHYDGPQKGAPYVNSMWEQQKEPYAGDVINSYNDGSPGPGKPPLGGFYEIETSSPGAELAPGKDLTHTHRTFHFVSDQATLDGIAKSALGVSLSDL
jgi:hypothetical protein